jgi:CRP/FNR family transcriptional regulator, cyclic AMP receptor protein
MEPTMTVMIGKDEVPYALHAQHSLSDGFIAYLLARTVRIEENLVDQLFYSAEKRLARALLRLARFGRQVGHQTRIPKARSRFLLR